MDRHRDDDLTDESLYGGQVNLCNIHTYIHEL